jgi:hypothetical protein
MNPDRVSSLLSARIVALCLGAAVGLAALPASPVLAQEASPDDVERKKKEREEAEKRKKELRESEVQETEEQREERERLERKDEAIKQARAKFAAAAQAAAKRQNQRGLELMEAAWMLDPTFIDYPLNTAAFAQALVVPATEFRAWAAVKVLAKKSLATLPPDSPKRDYFEENLAKAEQRLAALGATQSVGKLLVTSEPKTCELFVEGAYLGVGSGEMDVLTGERKLEAKCPAHFDTTQFVNVRSGDPTSTTIKPKQVPYFGKLVVKVEPADGVTIYLDDKPTADRLAEKASKEGDISGAGTKEQPFVLGARKWIIRFQKDGYDRWHRRIEVRRDQTTIVEARLESLAELSGGAPPPAKTPAPPAKGAKPAPGKPAPAPTKPAPAPAPAPAQGK